MIIIFNNKYLILNAIIQTLSFLYYYFRLNERSGNMFVLESVFYIDVDNIIVKKIIL